MLGYMSANKASAEGFTHHGKYFGIPVWLGDIDNQDGGLMVATKWAPMEFLMTAAHHIEGTLRPLLFPHSEPAFQFLVGAAIGSDTKGG